MYSRILVAIDGSIFSEQIVNQAIILAHTNQARLMLLHVCTDADKLTGNLEDKDEAFKLSRIDLLRSYCDVIRREGAIADLRAPSGDPGQQICEVAERWGADLILMGHRNLSIADQQVLNSVSCYVLDHAPCTLLVVPDHVNLPIVPTTVQKVAQTARHEAIAL